MAEEWNQVESFAQFLMYSHKIDLESYIQLRKSVRNEVFLSCFRFLKSSVEVDFCNFYFFQGELPSSGLVQKWIQKVTDVEKKLAELRNTSNKNQQKLSVTIAKQNFHNLESNPLVQPTERTALNDL